MIVMCVDLDTIPVHGPFERPSTEKEITGFVFSKCVKVSSVDAFVLFKSSISRRQNDFELANSSLHENMLGHVKVADSLIESTRN